MNKITTTSGLALCAAAAALALSACETSGERYAGGYGSAAHYDVWYDGYYGNINGGYWGSDAAYYYPGSDGRYIRDSGNHFRHDGFEGGHGMHAGQNPG